MGWLKGGTVVNFLSFGETMQEFKKDEIINSSAKSITSMRVNDNFLCSVT
jgi:hypothetical protein